jgi:tetratricopeptide (TPR) repeat protein
MRQKRLFALVVASSLSIASIGLTQVTPSPSASPSPTPIQSPDLKEADVKKLIQEEIKNGGDIRDRVQSDVNRTFGISMTLLQVLLGVLAALPIFTAIVFWCLRESIKNQLVAEAKQQVEKQLESEVAKKIHQETQKLQSEIDDASGKLDLLYENLKNRMEQRLKELPDIDLSASPSEKLPDAAIPLAEINLLRSLIPQFQLSYENYIQLGNGQFSENRYEEALASYNKAIELQPSGFAAWISHGNALAELSRYEEAFISYDKAIELNPNNYVVWLNYGNLLNRVNRYEESLIPYAKSIELKPDSYQVWRARAFSLLKLKRHEEALASCDKAIELEPEIYEVWTVRALILNDLKRYEESLACYDMAINLKPDGFEIWMDRTFVLGELKCYREALSSCDRAIELKPHSYQAWIHRGLILANLNRYEESLVSCDKAIKLNPASHEAWINRGVILANIKRYEEATASYDRAIELEPDDQYGTYCRVTSSRLGRSEEVNYNFVVAIKPSLANAFYNRACSYGLRNMLEEAILDLQKAIKLNSEFFELARTDHDFDLIRQSEAFQKLLNGWI